MKIPFTKMHGLGNDFIIFDNIQNPIIHQPDFVQRMSNRRIGVGCDQLIIIENTSMKSLLRKLTREIFIFDTRNALQAPLELPGFTARIMDDNMLEVEIEVGKEQSLNKLFTLFDGAGIEVTSMRNKSNRLEEMFVNLLKPGNIVGYDKPAEDTMVAPKAAASSGAAS